MGPSDEEMTYSEIVKAAKGVDGLNEAMENNKGMTSLEIIYDLKVVKDNLRWAKRFA